MSRSFGEQTALAGLTISLEPGDTLALFGPNGAGKTTLLKLLATLLVPSGGRMSVLGCRLPDGAEKVRGSIGYLGHEPFLYRELTPRENLRFYCTLYGVSEVERRLEELLDAVGVSSRADEPLRTLSRGTVQRVAVCRALLHDPDLLLLDEPYSHLDPAATRMVKRLIGQRAGLTRVLVTHDVESGLNEANRVLCLRDGRPVLLAESGLVSTADVRRAFGGGAG